MKKIILCMIVILGFVSLDIYLKYDMGPREYFKYSMPLTEEEENWLAEHGGIIYGADESAYPLSFYNQESLQLEGVLVDYFSHLSIEYGMKVTPVALSWEAVLQGLEDGTIMTADLFASRERKKKFDFTYPMYDLSANVIMLNQEGDKDIVRAVNDLRGEKLAIVKDDYSKEYLLEGLSWKKEHLVEVESIRDAMRLLETGKVKAVIGDEAVLDSYYTGERNAGKYYILEEPVYTMPVRFAVKKDNPVLLSILNKGVLQLKKDNIIQKTQSKWYQKSVPIVKDTSKYSLTLYTAGIIIAVFFLINRWNYVLRKSIKLKTRELEDSKNNIKKIIDTINLGIMVVSADGTIAESNIWIERFEQKQREDIVGKNLADFKKLTAIVKDFQKDDCETITFENLYYEVTTRPIAYMEETKHLVLLEDVTQKIIDEKMIRQQSKMVAMGHLTAGLAHEIRNPLGLIKSYLFLIGKRANDNQTQEAVAVCDNSVQRISNLITTLLSFTKQNHRDRQRIELSSLIKTVVALERKEASRHGISVKQDCDVVSVNCNEESLKVILINLVENAIEALSIQENAHPEIIITAKKEENAVVLSVADNGERIKESVQEHIFDPFFTTKDEGIGLGLYLVNSEVEKIGGRISLVCDQSGNKFIIYMIEDCGEE